MYKKIILALLFVVGIQGGPAYAQDKGGDAEKQPQATEQSDMKGMGCGCQHRMKEHKCGCPNAQKCDCPCKHKNKGDCKNKKDCPYYKNKEKMKAKKDIKRDKKA